MVYEAIGKIEYPIVPHKPQRSLIAIKNICENELFIENVNFKSIRPGGGIEPCHIEKIKDRRASTKIKKGTLLSWKLIGGY